MDSKKSPRLVFGGMGFLMIALFLFPLIFPETAAPFYQEDSALEMGSALLFLFGGVVGIWAAVRYRASRYWYALVAFFGILCGLEEIGYGERLLGYEPLTISRVKIDSLHDLPRVWKGKLADGTDHPYLVLMVIFALIGGAILHLLLKRARSGQQRWALPQHISLFAASVLCVLFGQLLDFLPISIALFDATYFEETLETAGGAFLACFACLSHGALPDRDSLFQPGE